MNQIRCKFKCDNVSKQTAGWTSEFSAVTDGSPENKAFFAATPSGQLTLGTVASDLFEVGQEYYLDLTPVVKE